jgi:hypothetical protein
MSGGWTAGHPRTFPEMSENVRTSATAPKTAAMIFSDIILAKLAKKAA